MQLLRTGSGPSVCSGASGCFIPPSLVRAVSQAFSHCSQHHAEPLWLKTTTATTTWFTCCDTESHWCDRGGILAVLRNITAVTWWHNTTSSSLTLRLFFLSPNSKRKNLFNLKGQWFLERSRFPVGLRETDALTDRPKPFAWLFTNCDLSRLFCFSMHRARAETKTPDSRRTHRTDG